MDSREIEKKLLAWMDAEGIKETDTFVMLADGESYTNDRLGGLPMTITNKSGRTRIITK